MSKDLKNLNILDLLPSSISCDETFFSSAESINKHIQDISYEIDKLYVLSRIDEIEEPLLSHLAYRFKVDFWEIEDSLQVKRDMIKNQISWQKRKGTPGAVEELLEYKTGGKAVVKEWPEYGGEQYHFKVEIDVENQGLTGEIYEKVDGFINKAKNERSCLDSVTLALTAKGSIKHAQVQISSETTVVYPWRAKELSQSHEIFLASGLHVIETTTIYPKN